MSVVPEAIFQFVRDGYSSEIVMCFGKDVCEDKRISLYDAGTH